MKTNELKCYDLRIGNYLKVSDPIFGVNIYKVATIRDNGIITLNDNISCLVDNIEPIELTEEVLVKIGFKKNIIYGSVIEYLPINNDLASIFCTKEKQNIRIQVVRKNASETIVKYIKYLHELQNAYYLLTGKELEVEL